MCMFCNFFIFCFDFSSVVTYKKTPVMVRPVIVHETQTTTGTESRKRKKGSCKYFLF